MNQKRIPYRLDFLRKAIQFANREEQVVYLNPNDYPNYPYGGFKHVLAFGVKKSIQGVGEGDWTVLEKFLENKAWIFGYLSYDLKNQLEKLSSNKPDGLGFSTLCFFIPNHILFIEKDSILIQSEGEIDWLIDTIESTPLLNGENKSKNTFTITPRISQKEYLETIKLLKRLILEGTIYEINFCQEYFVENCIIDPVKTYSMLNELAPMPFSCYVKDKHNFLICASPERFLKKERSKLISQPIKGTTKRGESEENDKKISLAMVSNSKERSENIMIIDLVRNDLSKFAKPGTVKAEEVCGLYSFPNVHQLISTVTAELRSEMDGLHALKAAFPMGSMTGAPKVRAMEIIDEIETVNRGLFSGAVGYFTPEGDFDFNVVIRSILYNSKNRYLSFQAGSAITFYADAEKEYEECEVKTKAIRAVIGDY